MQWSSKSHRKDRKLFTDRRGTGAELCCGAKHVSGLKIREKI
jgi:hypothetical protein